MFPALTFAHCWQRAFNAINTICAFFFRVFIFKALRWLLSKSFGSYFIVVVVRIVSTNGSACTFPVPREEIYRHFWYLSLIRRTTEPNAALKKRYDIQKSVQNIHSICFNFETQLDHKISNKQRSLMPRVTINQLTM